MVPFTPDQIRAAAKEIAIAAHSIVGWEVYAARIVRLVDEAVRRETENMKEHVFGSINAPL